MSRPSIGGGRRAAARTRGYRGDRTLPAAVTLLLLAVAAVAVAAGRSTPDRDPAPGATATGSVVDRSVLACPDTSGLAADGAGSETTVRAGLAPVRSALPDGGSLPDSGTLRVGEAGQDGGEQSLARGELVELAAEPGPVLDGVGAAAAGLFGYRVDRTPATTALARCVAPRGSWWFAGAGAGLDHGSDLVLTNVDPGPAVVDVRVYGPDGPVDAVGTRGIPIAPGETRTIAMTDVAPQTEELLVEVAADRGRVSAALVDRYAAEAGDDPGLEWLPGTDRPSRLVRLAGAPARARTRTLLVGNPSDRQALVQVRLAGAGGTFSPQGLAEVSVAPGSVASVDLTGVLPTGEPVAVVVAARVPVVATLRSVGPRDTAYAGAVDALTAPAAVPVLPGAGASVQLTAGGRAAVARVIGYTREGEQTGSDRLQVDATATASWQPEPDTAYVVVERVSGALFGAVAYAGTGVLAQTPLVPVPLTEVTPPVLPGPR